MQDFLAGKLEVLPGEYPNFSDWENHLTTIFPEVRLKRYIEMRGADGGPWKKLCALPALWVGLPTAGTALAALSCCEIAGLALLPQSSTQQQLGSKRQQQCVCLVCRV